MNRTYQIKQGDTLSDIARRHHTTADEIAKRNAIPAPHILYPGQTLILPDANALALDSAASIEGAMLAALCASNKDCKSPVGPCPFNNAETALVPVRYALDEPFEAPATQPHPLPATGFKGPLALNTPYTLRQLRDGWLYVFDETAHILDEYEVKGTQFIHANKGSKGHVLYPARHTVAMAFSHQRWTERLKTAYCEQDDLRSKGMRRFALPSLARNMGGPHAGLPALLASHVADMGLPNDGFVMSCAPLKAPDGVEPGLLWRDKPAGSSYASRANMPDPQSALVVALDDLISDMHDVTEHLSDTLLRYERPFNDDDTRHRWAMATITEMLALPPLDEYSLPAPAKGDRLATFKLKKQLQSYLVAKHDYKERQGSGNHYTDPGAEQLLMKQHAELKQQGVNPDTWADWPGVRFDDEVNWSGLEEIITQYGQEIDALRPRWLATYDDALQLLQALPSSPLQVGLDSQTVDAQTFLLANCGQWLFSLNMAPDAQRSEQLTAALKAGVLPALAHYGFDIDVKKELENNPDWVGVGNITGAANALAALEAIANNDLLSNNKVFGGLHEGAKATVNALKSAIAGAAIKPWQQLSELLHPHLLKGEKLGRLLSLVVLESFHTAQQVRINKAFIAESNAFVYQVQRNILGKLAAVPGTKITEGYLGRMKAAGAEWQQLEWPRLLLQEGGVQQEFERRLASYLTLQRQGAKGAQAAARVWQDWGNFGGLAALLNIANLTVALQGYDENARKLQGNPAAQLELSRNLAYTAAWTGSAMVAIKQGQVVVPTHLLEKRLALAMKDNPALARRFALTTGWMTGLGLLAAGLEAWETWQKTEDNTNADMEQFGYQLKLSGLAAQGGAMGRSLMLLGRGASLGAIWAPWMVAAIGIGSLLYLAATVILARYSRQPIERWLLQSTWGTKPAGWSATEELFQYERIASQPTVALKEGMLTVELPPRLRTITLHLSVRRLSYALAKQSYPASITTPVLGPAQEAVIKVASKGPGQVTLAIAANQGDELLLQIGYPVAETLSGQPLRFMARGTLAKGVVLTAEIDDKLPVQGTFIELK
ncbi:LysM domain-containing protein [Aeromonas veronii]|uniref:LysM domain-containing protein n=1 Tax=Aeromonas veronii TaxID=654 RepID=A0A3A9ISN9_AERVE|nr:toxin VasX [Aeromonas veronii]RKJ84522.1 LysM domain-containing protein [Aeromonas veronii]RKJ87223.1 LysM domain-containing protein [Aeromonas veronii]RKJ89482.1 LysM domain-containing protein [Aeromonas veronii]